MINNSFAPFYSQHSLYEAWIRVARNNGCAGVDQQSINHFRKNASRTLIHIADQLERDTYAFSPLKGILIPKENDKLRKIAIPTVSDRIVLQALNAKLQDLWDPYFSSYSFAYRPGRGVSDAIRSVKKRLQRGQTWYIKGDIQGCFDSLDWELLSYILRDTLSDQKIRKLLNKSFRMPVIFNGQVYQRSQGVPQGSPLSPILSNLYLHQFDIQMSDNGFTVIRYGDDWICLVSDKKQAIDGFYTAADILSDLKIIICPHKSGIGDLKKETINFLGYRLNTQDVSPSLKAWENLNNTIHQLKTARDKKQYERARGKLMHFKSQYAESCTLRERGENGW